MEVLNSLEEKRLTAILARLVPSIADDSLDSIFSNEEADKLAGVLSIDRQQLNELLAYLKATLRQAAYSLTKPNQLLEQLQQSGVAEQPSRILADVWSNTAKDIVEALKARPFAAKELADINWKLGITMAQSSKANTRIPMATLDFSVRDNQREGQLEHVTVEFTHDELYQFFLKLEDIQSKLDELTG